MNQRDELRSESIDPVILFLTVSLNVVERVRQAHNKYSQDKQEPAHTRKAGDDQVDEDSHRFACSKELKCKYPVDDNQPGEDDSPFMRVFVFQYEVIRSKHQFEDVQDVPDISKELLEDAPKGVALTADELNDFFY